LTIFTIGHSTRSAEDFIALLRRSGVQRVYDIRAFPGSRRYPQFNSEALAERLRSVGIAYEHHPELGGRRRPSPDAPPTAWRNEAFRGYAEYMRTDAFRGAIDRLVAAGREMTTAIMCSEAVPWRCHRNLVSDALVARGTDVQHILDAKTSPHTLTSFAAVEHEEVFYPPVGELGQQALDLNSK
jgi:uncharacterized protein (DUF488 family)